MCGVVKAVRGREALRCKRGIRNTRKKQGKAENGSEDAKTVRERETLRCKRGIRNMRIQL